MILVVPYLLRENAFGYFQLDDDTTDAGQVKPRIICPKLCNASVGLHVVLEEDATYEVKVEKCSLGTTNDFLKAFAMYIASFYIFNVVYPQSIEHTLCFVQKLFLKLSDSTKTSARVLSLIAKLKRAN